MAKIHGLGEATSARTRRLWWIATLVVVAVLVAAPYGLQRYALGLLTHILIVAVFAMSLDLLIGYTGLLSLGHAAFFGAGAYTIGILAKHSGVDSLVGLPLAVLVGGLIAAVFGPFVLRVTGAYCLMLTLALAQLLFGIAWFWRSMTGGDDGLAGLPRPALPWDINLWDERVFYYFILVITLIAALTMFGVVNSAFGLALRGVRDNELRMASLGYNPWLLKYVVYVIAGCYAALAGALEAYYLGYVGTSVLSWTLSGEVIIMLILGGLGSLWGPSVGAAIVELLKFRISSETERWVLILGLIFILTVFLAPKGLTRLPAQLLARYRRRQAGAVASAD